MRGLSSYLREYLFIHSCFLENIDTHRQSIIDTHIPSILLLRRLLRPTQCRDCQLQVDARLPCGSELAKIAVRKAQQYQVPPLSKIMTTIAPHLDTKEATLEFGSEGNPSPKITLLSHEGRSIDGIGIMNVRILRACIFDKKFPPEAEPGQIFESDFNLRDGDHYVRVSWLGSKDTRRTKTVLQTPQPIFDSEEMVFDVPHYGMEYKLEVVDANTDKSIGSCLLSAQGLLQWQRDDIFASIDRTLLSLFHLRKHPEPRRLKLELRTGVKNGFGLNFYISSMSSEDPSKEKESSQRPGEISGWLEIDVHLEEDRQLFYSINPRRIGRPEEEFDLNVIQLHIARLTAIFEDLQKMVSTYFYVVSWENQELTGVCAVRSFPRFYSIICYHVALKQRPTFVPHFFLDYFYCSHSEIQHRILRDTADRFICYLYDISGLLAIRWSFQRSLDFARETGSNQVRDKD
jgi:hypothetical protein